MFFRDSYSNDYTLPQLFPNKEGGHQIHRHLTDQDMIFNSLIMFKIKLRLRLFTFV